MARVVSPASFPLPLSAVVGAEASVISMSAMVSEVVVVQTRGVRVKWRRSRRADARRVVERTGKSRKNSVGEKLMQDGSC